MAVKHWTKEEVCLVLNLYCKLPYGKMNHTTPEVIKLAKFLNRTPSAISMRLCNFAALDPTIEQKGMSNVAKLDKEVWKEFFNNEDAINDIEEKSAKIYDTEMNPQIDSTPNFFVDDAVASVKVRRLQGFFRKTIIASYDSKCCITGISIPTFLVASHIIPWADDRENRLNPQNGLCLNIMHDKAFDKGFMTLDSDFRIVFSKELPRKAEYEFLLKYEGKKISMPHKFSPSQKFLDFHRNNIFRG